MARGHKKGHNQSADETLALIANEANAALMNRGLVNGQSPTIPGTDAIHAEIGVKLTAKASGIFMLTVSGEQAAAAQTEVVTWTVTTYTDAVVGVPLTLPANAQAAGTNCFIDNSGAGIAPSAGATGGTVDAADATTIGTAAIGSTFSWSGLTNANGAVIPKGSTFYATLSITNSATARAVTNACISAYELP